MSVSLSVSGSANNTPTETIKILENAINKSIQAYSCHSFKIFYQSAESSLDITDASIMYELQEEWT